VGRTGKRGAWNHLKVKGPKVEPLGAPKDVKRGRLSKDERRRTGRPRNSRKKVPKANTARRRHASHSGAFSAPEATAWTTLIKKGKGNWPRKGPKAFR